MSFASYGIWSHLHRSCGHLPLLAKLLTDAAMPQFAPSLGFSNPFPAVGWISLRALAAPSLHETAIRNVVHGNSPTAKRQSEPKPTKLKDRAIDPKAASNLVALTQKSGALYTSSWNLIFR
jgi:hypothetical protein